MLLLLLACSPLSCLLLRVVVIIMVIANVVGFRDMVKTCPDAVQRVNLYFACSRGCVVENAEARLVLHGIMLNHSP